MVGARRVGRECDRLKCKPLWRADPVPLLLVAAVPTGRGGSSMKGGQHWLARFALRFGSNPLTNPVEQGDNKKNRHTVSIPLHRAVSTP